VGVVSRVVMGDVSICQKVVRWRAVKKATDASTNQPIFFGAKPKDARHFGFRSLNPNTNIPHGIFWA
jgi:hypothetical protein